MHRAGVEEQRVAGQQMIRLLPVPVDDLAGEHVDELDAGVAERRVGHGVLLQRDQKRLDDDVAAERVTEKLIYVSGLGAAPFDDHPLIGANERTVAALLERGEEVGDGYAESRGDGLDRRERRRDLSVSILDNMPIEMLEAAARSETDKSWLRRRRRTGAPIARSSVRSAGFGALEPVVYSFAFAAFVGERAFFFVATFVDL